MSKSKISTNLVDQIGLLNSHEVIDVVVELASSVQDGNERLDRKEKVRQQKETFENSMRPLGTAIHELGGELIDRAWINQTLLARIPVRAVQGLSEIEQVLFVDTPSSLQAD